MLLLSTAIFELRTSLSYTQGCFLLTFLCFISSTFMLLIQPVLPGHFEIFVVFLRLMFLNSCHRKFVWIICSLVSLCLIKLRHSETLGLNWDFGELWINLAKTFSFLLNTTKWKEVVEKLSQSCCSGNHGNVGSCWLSVFWMTIWDKHYCEQQRF